MHRLLALIAAMGCLLAFAACKSNKPEGDNSSSGTSSVTEVDVPLDPIDDGSSASDADSKTTTGSGASVNSKGASSKGTTSNGTSSKSTASSVSGPGQTASSAASNGSSSKGGQPGGTTSGGSSNGSSSASVASKANGSIDLPVVKF